MVAGKFDISGVCRAERGISYRMGIIVHVDPRWPLCFFYLSIMHFTVICKSCTMLISHTERGFEGGALLDILSFSFTVKYCQISLSAASGHVSPERCSLLYESCLSRSSFETPVLLRLLETERLSFKIVVLFLYSVFITYLDMQSCVWGQWQSQYVSMQRPFCHFIPHKSVIHFIPGNLFSSLFQQNTVTAEQ